MLTTGLSLMSVLATATVSSIERRYSALQSGPAEAPARGRDGARVSHAVLFGCLAALFFLQGADSTRNVYLPLVTFQLFKDAGIAPLMFSISAAVELVATAAVGFLAARIGEARTIFLGALIGAAYFVVLSFSRWLPALYAANVLYAVFIASLMGVAMSFVYRLVPGRAGVGGALYLATFSGGTLFGAVSPLLVQGYSPRVFLVSACLCVVGSLLIRTAGADGARRHALAR